MPIRLVAIDLDGTLLDREYRISPANRAAIDACRQAGAHVLIATGRMFASVERYTRELGFDDWQITANGAVLAHPRSGELQVRRHMTPHELRTVVTVLARHTAPYLVFSPSRIATEHDNPLANSLSHYGEPPSLLHSRDELMALPDVVKVLTFAPAGAADATLGDALRATVDVIRTGADFLEFLPHGVGKGAALADLMQRYGVPGDEVLAIGDNENDLSMFAVAGMSVAMANAAAHIRTSARAVTASVDHDGVALALRRYVLGEA